MNGNTPPWNLAAEQVVLGSMMESKDAIADVTEIIEGRDLYRPAHQIIWESILALYERGEPTDVVTVLSDLIKRGEIKNMGGADYLHTLIASVPSHVTAGYYAGIVRENAILRRLAESGNRIVQMGTRQAGTGYDADELVDRARAEVDGILNGSGSRSLRDMGELTRVVLDSIEGDAPLLHSVRTGLVDLDLLLNGLRGGQLIIVAGRPAMGKSVMGLGFAVEAAVRQGRRARIHTLEMSAEELTMRFLSAEAAVNLHSLISHDRLDDRQWERLAAARKSVLDAPLQIDDTPVTSLATIRHTQRRDPADLLVIDYLQLVAEPPKSESRQLAVATLARGFKLIAKEYDVPVVVMAQLNRGPETRHNKRPLLADLRESGEIEQSADVVILLHREDAYEPESPRAGEIDVIVAKHRNGPTATITACFQGHFSRIRDMARI